MKAQTKVITDPVRTSFVRVTQPDENGKFGLALLLDKKKNKKTILAIEDAIEAAIEQGIQTKWGGKEPKKLALPLHDGDIDSEREEYEGCMYLNPKSNDRPGIVGPDLEPITDREEIYSGMHVIASITFAPYNHTESGKKGVGVYLSHIMKVKDDERLGGGRSKVEDDFADVDTSRFDTSRFKASKSKKRRDDDEDEARPTKRRTSRRDDDDEEEPRKKRSSRYDEDEEEDEYYKPKKKKSSRYDDDDLPY